MQEAKASAAVGTGSVHPQLFWQAAELSRFERHGTTPTEMDWSHAGTATPKGGVALTTVVRQGASANRIALHQWHAGRAIRADVEETRQRQVGRERIVQFAINIWREIE